MELKKILAGLVLLFLANAVLASSAIPNMVGQYVGVRTLTTFGCLTPSNNGKTDTKIVTIEVTSQVPSGSPGLDMIQGTSYTTANDFWPAESESFTGYLFENGTFGTTFSPSGDTEAGTFSSGIFNVQTAGSDFASNNPYASDSCQVLYSPFTLVGGSTAPLEAAVSAGTEIVAGNTQVLQSFVNNTILPVTSRIQNIVVNLVKPGLVSEGSRFDMTPVAGGFKLSGQTGRAAGGDFRNMAGWGSLSYTELENDNPLTAYDGDRMAFQFGLDYMPRDNMVAGISLGYEDMDVTTTFNRGSMDGQGFTLAPYIGAVIDDNWSFDALVGFSSVDYDQNRAAGTITGSTAATRFFAATNLNHNYGKKDEWLIMSRVGLMYAEETTNGFIERLANGAVAAINPERSTRLIQGQIGVDFTYLAEENFEPYLNVTYNYDLISSGTNIVVGGVAVNPFDDRDDLLLGAGFNYYVSDNSTASMELKQRVLREDFNETIFSASYRANF